MASDRRVTCVICGNHRSVVGPISWRGNCGACARERIFQAGMEMYEKRGPTYRRWDRNLRAALDRVARDAAKTTA